MAVFTQLSPEAMAGLDALGRILKEMTDVERSFVAGDIHGRVAALKARQSQREGSGDNDS